MDCLSLSDAKIVALNQRNQASDTPLVPRRKAQLANRI